MAFRAVPTPLQERLGPEGSSALLQLLAETRKDCVADVTSMVSERFERRLVEETSKLRVEMAQGFAGVRAEIAGLRHEMSDQRFDILKWAFLFWVGQFFAVASLMAVLIRFLRTP